MEHLKLLNTIMVASSLLGSAISDCWASPRQRYEELIIADNQFEPIRVCLGAQFLSSNDYFGRLGLVYGSTRFRMNATNVRNMLLRMQAWENGQGRVRPSFAAQLRGVDQKLGLEYSTGSWSDMAQACSVKFKGFFDFDGWLRKWSVDFDQSLYRKTLQIWDQYESDFCYRAILPYYDGNRLAVWLPNLTETDEGRSARIEQAIGKIDLLKSQSALAQEQVDLIMQMKVNNCDRFIQ
jgi:hypothetical protein